MIFPAVLNIFQSIDYILHSTEHPPQYCKEILLRVVNAHTSLKTYEQKVENTDLTEGGHDYSGFEVPPFSLKIKTYSCVDKAESLIFDQSEQLKLKNGRNH